jgi:outer membrane protein OmpA-like peptidoglycan-associated protein
MKTISALGLIMALSSVAACGSAVVPKEVASARSAYDRAASGPAASLNPTDLHTAREALDAAETSFKQDGDTPKTRDLGYAAERSAETAESKARAMQAQAETAQIVEQMHATTAQRSKMTAAELARANQELASKDQALAAQGAALTDEVKRREEAEKRAAQAAADIAKFASIKQETRGMVITLSGSVLFTSGKSELLPGAQMKLNEVAKALTEQDPEAVMVVEGHTDSQGGAEFNQKLSQQRAQAVRDYLVSRGIASDRITAEGFGPTRTIGDNATPEGRANNRRVEIVVKPKAG